MMGKETLKDSENQGACSGSSSPTKSHSSRASTPSQLSIDRDLGFPTCVCQCVESDNRGDTALGFLGIDPPQKDSQNLEELPGPGRKRTMNDVKEHTPSLVTIQKMEPGTVDFKKVLASLKDYEALRDRTASGAPNPAQVHDNSGVDPDSVAAICRQRLSEIYLWFNPLGNLHHNNAYNENAPAVLVVTEPPANVVVQDATPPQNTATKWAVEGTEILLATGLLTVTLAWLIAPRAFILLLSEYYLKLVFLSPKGKAARYVASLN